MTVSRNGQAVAAGSRILGVRNRDRGPCSRCGREIEYRNDRPHRTCGDCRKVDPEWGAA